MPSGSDSLGAIGILVLVVFGGVYITQDAGSLNLIFSNDILNLALLGIAVAVIVATIYANLSDL